MIYYDTNEGILKATTLAELALLAGVLTSEGVALDTELESTVVITVGMKDPLKSILTVTLESKEEVDNGLPEATGNPCIKTGCRVLVGDSYAFSNHTWYGDLFRFGDYLLLNCNSGVETIMPENRSPVTVNLFARSWNMVWKGGTVVMFDVGHVKFFSYDGLPGDHFDGKSG